MTDLKPCPLCGGKAKLKRGLPRVNRAPERYALVQCLDCMARTQTYRQAAMEPGVNVDEYAARHWNTRPAEKGEDK